MNESNETNWPLGKAERKKFGKAHWLNRISDWLHQRVAGIVSNLRLSLTLRIALHYACQLLKTTLPMLAVLISVFWMAQIPEVSKALDKLCLVRPEEGVNYSRNQLLGMPFTQAYETKENITSVWQHIKLAASSLLQDEFSTMKLAVNGLRGSVIAVWNVEHLIRNSIILMWTFLLGDLYRVLSFLNHRSRLNQKVLKPITDMAEKAATLSANNLSDRLSVEGAKNELKDLALVINGMLDRIEVSYNSQKQFVSDASHELRTPIAVIQGYTSMLERWGKTDKDVLDEGITAIAQEAASMKELVERLLFLARHDKQTLMLEVEEFDPLEVLSEVYREAYMLSKEHHFKLEPAETCSISGDKDMIKQLMRILLDNAIKYTPPGGRITLGVSKERNGCSLSVSDTGAGIPPEEMTRIFERFYRCDEARKGQASGHGLGLSIARIIVSAHRGKMKVRSKVGVGTTFSVHFPAYLDQNKNRQSA